MGKLNLPVAAKTGIAKGLNKGHITTRIQLKAKPSNRKGVSERRERVVVRMGVGDGP